MEDVMRCEPRAMSRKCNEAVKQSKQKQATNQKHATNQMQANAH
jgi:hypothetical protein